MKQVCTRPIVVAEDNDDDFTIIQERLTKRRIDNPVIRVTDGEACLRLLRNQGQPMKPALLLLDLNLPGIDGRDVLEVIKSDTQLRSIPVIVLTTSANPRDIEVCYHFGVNSYHLKPLAVPEFRSIIDGIASYWTELSVLPGEQLKFRWPKTY